MTTSSSTLRDSRSVASRIGSHLLSITALLGVLCIVATTGAVAFDLRPLVFRSGSMAPAIETGALAVAQTAEAEDVAVGDVVSVIGSDGNRITHRVESVTAEGEGAVLVLKGDANRSADAELYPVTTVERVLVDVPKLGYAVAWMSGTGGVVLGSVVVGSALLMFIWSASGRSSGGGARRATVVTVVLVMGAGLASGPRPQSTLAAFIDTATVRSESFGSGVVTKPVATGCTTSNPLIGTKSLTTTWRASTVPRVLTYGAVLRETGQNLTIVLSGDQRSVTVTTGLLGSLFGSTFHIDVTASLPGTAWTARSTRTGSVELLGVAITCGSWN